MPDFAAAMTGNHDLPEETQKQIAQAQGDDMDDEHKNFLALIIKMLDEKTIDIYESESFLKKDVYDTLDDEWKMKVDKALPNLALQLRQIEAFYRNKAIPDASPELQNMIEHLWQMKQRIEEKHDVFKF